MASALDPIFAYHWIDTDLEIEHNEAQTSQAQHIIKRKNEELVLKKEVLTKNASSSIIAKTAVSSTSSMKMFKKMTAKNLLLNFPHFLNSTAVFAAEKIFKKRQKIIFTVHQAYSL